MEHMLVTGGAGFLGSHLCDLLLSHGYRVTAIDNLITGCIDNIAHNLTNPDFEFIEQNITNPLRLDTKVDGIFHLASPASPVDYQHLPIDTLSVGSLGTHRALELARLHGARFLLASTSEIYGDPLVHPQREDYWGNVNPIGPRSVYDEAKRFAEALTMAYYVQYQLQTRIARIFNTYGPRMRLDDGRVVPTLIHQALTDEPLTVYGDGSQTRSFCYVSDEIEGIYRLFESDCSDPVNIGSPAEFTILEFAEQIKKLTGTNSDITFQPLPKDDPRRRRPDITKASNLLECEPRIDMEEGLSRTIEYIRSRMVNNPATVGYALMGALDNEYPPDR